MTRIYFILFYIIVPFIGKGETVGKTQEEERESDDENNSGLPEEVRNFVQALNEDHNENENKNKNEDKDEDEDKIEHSDIKVKAAIREDDKFQNETVPIYEDEKSLSNDTEEQEKMEACLSNKERYEEQTIQCNTQNAVFGNNMHESENSSSPPISSNNLHNFSSSLSFLPSDIKLQELTSL